MSGFAYTWAHYIQTVYDHVAKGLVLPKFLHIALYFFGVWSDQICCYMKTQCCSSSSDWPFLLRWLAPVSNAVGCIASSFTCTFFCKAFNTTDIYIRFSTHDMSKLSFAFVYTSDQGATRCIWSTRLSIIIMSASILDHWPVLCYDC